MAMQSARAQPDCLDLIRRFRGDKLKNLHLLLSPKFYDFRLFGHFSLVHAVSHRYLPKFPDIRGDI